MKSEYQLCYDRFVIATLCGMDLSIKERASLVQNFFENSQFYYESLCDDLFFLASGQAPGQSLWLAFDGQAYLSLTRKAPHDICLMPADNCPPFADDITEHLQQICCSMQGMLSGA